MKTVQQEQTDRRAYIFRRALEGCTFNDLAVELGICPTRVAQIFHALRRKLKRRVMRREADPSPVFNAGTLYGVRVFASQWLNELERWQAEGDCTIAESLLNEGGSFEWTEMSARECAVQSRQGAARFIQVYVMRDGSRLVINSLTKEITHK